MRVKTVIKNKIEKDDIGKNRIFIAFALVIEMIVNTIMPFLSGFYMAYKKDIVYLFVLIILIIFNLNIRIDKDGNLNINIVRGI